jgi:hypothetical protein
MNIPAHEEYKREESNIILALFQVMDLHSGLSDKVKFFSVYS